MKHILLSLLAATATTVMAAETTSTTTTTTTIISEFAPGSSLVVKESSGPVTYRYGKEVTYVTKSGRVLSDADVRTRLRVGAPVSVHYDTLGDARVVNRVIIDDDDREIEVDRDNDDDDIDVDNDD
jgi:hypothetical protein